MHNIFISFLYPIIIPCWVQNKKAESKSSFQKADFASLSQSTCWSEAEDLKYPQLLLQTFYLKVKLKSCCYLQN